MASETTKDHWAFDGPYYIARRGEQNILEWFPKNVVWIQSEGGYCILDPFNKDHLIKVEFSPHTLCWAEVHWLDNRAEWESEEHQWEIFCPCPTDLRCDIYLLELTTEELHHIMEDQRILYSQHLYLSTIRNKWRHCCKLSWGNPSLITTSRATQYRRKALGHIMSPSTLQSLRNMITCVTLSPSVCLT